MSSTTYLTATMTVDRTPEEVFAAVTNVRGWWSENLIGDTAALHDEFVFTDDSTHPGETAQANTGIRFARFQLTEVAPGRRVVWHVVDSYLAFIEDHGEWTDTNVVFDITTDGHGTTLHFTHEGLTAAESACFQECSRGWTFYITQSLPQLITTGAGQPITRYNHRHDPKGGDRTMCEAKAGCGLNLQKIYTALLTADLAAAEGWYTKLLGRGPDNRPMDTLVQWELFDQGGLALSTDDDIAGRGVMFLYVDDVATERRRLQALGIVVGDDIEGEYSTLSQVRDPDGNLLTLATPPSRPFPPASPRRNS